MKLTLILLGCLILAALVTILAARKLPSLAAVRRAFGRPGGVVRVNALTSGIHPTGKKAYKADAALSTRHLLVKQGSDADHFAVGTAADEPLGVCQDEPSAAEEPANVALLGAVQGTVLMVGNEAINAGEWLYGAANGKVQNQPAAAGAYWRVGKAVDACTGDGNAFEALPCIPTRVVIVANAADLTALKTAVSSPSVIMALGA